MPSKLTDLKGFTLPESKYHLLERTHISNMSVVYQAEDTITRRMVAVKLMRDPAYIAEFQLEVDILWAVSNIPNVVQVLRDNLRSAPERLNDGTEVKYIATRWINGVSLSDKMRQNEQHPKPTKVLLQEAVFLLNRLAPALDQLHRRRVLHLDVKPSNILFDVDPDDGSEEPYLIDFGVSRRLDAFVAEDSTITETPKRAGTSRYMPKEQWEGIASTGATDQYALALTVYEYLTGESPYKEAFSRVTATSNTSTDASHRDAWKTVHIYESPTRIHYYKPELPNALWDVLRTALHKDDHQRYRTVTEFAQAFEEAAQHPFKDALEQSEPHASENTDALAALSARVPPQRRRGGLLLVGLIVLIVGAALIGFALLSPANRDGTATPAPATTDSAAVAAVTESPTAEPTETDAPTEAPSDTPSSAAAAVEVTDEPTPTATNTRAPTTTKTPTEEPSPIATDTAVPSATNTMQPTVTNTTAPTRTPRSTATRTATRTPTRTPSPTMTPTPVEIDYLAVLEAVSSAARSANTFDCAAFVAGIDRLREAANDDLGAELQDTADTEQALVAAFVTDEDTVTAVYDYCARSANRTRDRVALPSTLLNPHRELRSALREVVIAVTSAREE